MKKFAGLIAALSLAALTGCGGGGGDELSKSEFITQADAICKKSSDRIDAAATAKFSTQPTQAQQDEFVLETVLPEIQGQLDGISGLEAPADDQDEVDAVVAAAQDGVDTATDDPAQLNNTDFEKANKLGGEFGFKVCASG